MQIVFESVGTVRNCVKEKKDTGWGEDISEIVLDEALSQGLTGLSDFSHVLVVCYLDKAHFELSRHLVRRPQGRDNMPMVGIFAQRAKDRPNPIGITACELLGVSDNVVTVRGLDAIDGTPVLDIKPYFPMYDCREDAVIPQWVSRLMEHYF
ncbi:tRNA (adenine(37)-N6)-methyltransferase [bioreactor metagenome]|uniref:tRNA (Adenine(37)-N6)-methyltransferase n=1 Tax=bioreactor metagenome TaxID=1076179 RepID=A0A644XA03_9ZZZZ